MSSITADVLTQLVTAVGVLAFAVSVITEVLKNVSFIKRIPTDLLVITLSIVLTVVALFAYVQYSAIVVTWYWVVAAIICGFFVAFIAMYGWDKLSELWYRFKYEK